MFIYLSSLLLVIKNLELSKINKFLIFIFLIILSHDYTYHSNWSIFSGYQEILIFSLTTFAMIYLYKLSLNNKNNELINILSILLICNALVWIKHEGFLISLSLILSIIIFFNLNTQKKLIILGSFLLIIFLRFYIFNLYELNQTGTLHSSFENFNFNNFLYKFNIERIFTFLSFLLLNLFTNYLFILGLIILLLIRFKNKDLKYLNYLFFIFFFNIVAFCIIYLLSDRDLTFMLRVGMDRTVFQLSPFIFIILFKYFNKRSNL